MIDVILIATECEKQVLELYILFTTINISVLTNNEVNSWNVR